MNIINGFLEYVAPNTSPRALNYIRCADLDRILVSLKDIPKYYLAGNSWFSAGYYKSPVLSSTQVGGSASLNLFLKAPEVVEYLMQFPVFVDYCANNNITWFLNSTHSVKVSKNTTKHLFLEFGVVDAMKDFK